MKKIRNLNGQTEQEFLKEYDDSMYRHPSCTVDMLLMTVISGALNILLIKRKDHPWINQWALPGGFINYEEDMEEAVLRELKEETNIDSANYFKQLYTLGKADRDPRTRVITTAYLSLTPETNLKNMHAGDDASEAKWFEITKQTIEMTQSKRKSRLVLENKETETRLEYEVEEEVERNYIKRNSRPLLEERLAADHIKLINMAMDEIQNHVASSGLMFNLLPAKFTLKQAQDVYETLTSKKVDTANFRRDILKMLNETGEKTETYRNRKTKTYTFNPLFNYLKEDL